MQSEKGRALQRNAKDGCCEPHEIQGEPKKVIGKSRSSGAVQEKNGRE